jgi:hypothetical protein
MFSKKNLLIMGLVSLSFTAFAGEWNDGAAVTCDAYHLVSDRLQNEFNQFDQLVIRPLQDKKADITSKIALKTDRPAQIDVANRTRNTKIISLQADNEKRAGLIANETTTLEQKKAELAAAQSANNRARVAVLKDTISQLTITIKTRQNNTVLANGEISRLQAMMAQAEAEKQTILTNAPSLSELNAALQDVNDKLLNTKDLRNQKLQDVKLAVNAYNLCVNYTELQNRVNRCEESYRILQNSCIR